MINYISFKGISNFDMGVAITTMPSVITPSERGESIIIPGRNGALWKSENAWDEVSVIVQFWIPPTVSLDTVRLWLMGEGQLKLDRNAFYYYKARITSAITYTPYSFDDGWQASVEFACYPFRYAVVQSDIEVHTPSTIIPNPHTAYTEPRLTIYGSGEALITLNSTTLVITNIENGMSIDTELQEAYIDERLLNHIVSGNFPTLEPGDNTLYWEGNISKIIIEPRWRAL